MNKWKRPDGYRNPFPDAVEVPSVPMELLPDIQTLMHRAYEAGANEVTKKLVEQPPEASEGRLGKWVFICYDGETE